MGNSAFLELATRIWRRKLWVIIPAVVGLAAGVLAVKNADKKYRATALILVEAQKIPTDIVEDTVTPGVVERLFAIEKQVKQQAILEQIVRELGLYPQLVRDGQINAAVARARNSLAVKQNRRDRTVSISFSGPGRIIVAHVANRIAEIVIEENNKLRESHTKGTSAFIADQIADAQARMEATADKIAELRGRWAGRLPEERAHNQSMLADLQRRLETVEVSIENAETRRLLLQQVGMQGLDETRQEPQQAELLAQLKQRLQQLLAQYTDKHPDVIRLRSEIAAVEQLVTAEQEPQVASLRPEELVEDPLLRAELAAIDSELGQLQSDRVRIETDMAVYRRRLQGVPEVEQQLATLERQYSNEQGFHGQLLKQQIEARLAENLEARQESEQFKIIERARPPAGPYSPNVASFLLMGLGLGGAVGVGLLLMREETDHTFRDPDSLKAAFPGVTILSVIPRLGERPVLKYSRLRRKRTA